MLISFDGFKLISYSGCNPHLVMSNQQLVSSLGSEAVMLRVSVDKRTFGAEMRKRETIAPKCLI